MNELEIERRLTSTEKLAGSNRHRIDEIEKRQDNMDSLVSSVAVMAKEQENIKEDVSEIKSDVKALTTKPGKRWDGLVDVLTGGLAGSLLTFLLAKILGG